MPRFISRGPATPVDDFTESRMKIVDLAKPYGKSGEMGHPKIFLLRKAVEESTRFRNSPFRDWCGRTEAVHRTLGQAAIQFIQLLFDDAAHLSRLPHRT
jgi:hypothetical protein